MPLEQGAPIGSTSTTGTGRVNGISCGPTEQLAYHIHAHLLVNVNGSPRALPGGVGIPGSQVDVRVGLKPQELREIIGGYEALAVRSATKVTKEILEAAQKLRVIGRAGTGVDNIDLAAASRRGVVVMNAPGGNSVSVAEHTMALLLALARQIADASQSTRAGKWEKKRFSSGRELQGKTLGVIGTGSIGGLVVRRAQAFGMKVLGYDPFLAPEAAAKLGVELVDLPEIWKRCDAITLHVPLTEQTKNMVGKEQLAHMKPGGVLVNCARGGLVDEKALADALRTGKIAGAALDVFEQEPLPAEHPLWTLPGVLITPHTAGYGPYLDERRYEIILDNCSRFLAGQPLRNLVDKARWF